jgi:hypothetical protein
MIVDEVSVCAMHECSFYRFLYYSKIILQKLLRYCLFFRIMDEQDQSSELPGAAGAASGIKDASGNRS